MQKLFHGNFKASDKGGGFILDQGDRAAHKGGRHFPRKTEGLLPLIDFVEFARF